MSPSASASTPLLSQSDSLDYQSQSVPSKHTPLPRTQLATLCTIKFVEPINFTQIFPYVNEQIRNLHICDPNSVGLYSGIIESSFAIAQLLSVVEWARLSDKIGRRPVIIAGTLGVMITSLIFGMSRSFFMLVFSRALAGLFCGNIAALQSVLGEITDSTNQATAFPLFAMTWPMGSILGPLIGGSLSNPAKKYPRFNVKFLETYPYFLPCFVVALIALIGALLAFFLLEETSPIKRKDGREKLTCSSSSTLVETEDIPALEHDVGPPPSCSSIKQLLQIPILTSLSISGCGLSFVSTAFDVVFVLFAYSPVHSGGLSLSDGQIGYTLAISGCVASILQIFILPGLLRRFDTASMYNICLYFFPLSFALMPILNIIAKSKSNSGGGGDDALIWTGIALSLILSRIGNVAYGLSMILIKENTPNPESLGAVNGLVQWSMCLARAIAPTFVSTTFAISQQWNIMHGYFWAILFVFISLCVGLVGRCITTHSNTMQQPGCLPPPASFHVLDSDAESRCVRI